MKERTEWRPAAPVAENVGEFLPPMIEEFFAHGREVVTTGAKPRKLHEFRLRAKRLRYTLELFEPVIGEELAEALGRLRALQESLGKISDCAATRSLIRRSSAGSKRDRKRVLKVLKKRQASRIDSFLKLWRSQFGREGAEAELMGLFDRSPGHSTPAA